MFGRRKIATLLAEFLGTGVLTLAIISVQHSQLAVPFFWAIAGGLALAVATFVFGGISGAHFNPAVTVGMFVARRITALNAVLYIIVQFLGAWAAYGLFSYMFHNELRDVGGQFTGRALVAEAVGTFIFTLGFAASLYRSFTPAAVASFRGVAYLVGILTASTAAIGLLNPAVAFGVRAWVWEAYALGPILGAIIGINLYNMLFAASAGEVATEAIAVNGPGVAATAANGVSTTADTAASARKPRSSAAKTNGDRKATTRSNNGNKRSSTRKKA